MHRTCVTLAAIGLAATMGLGSCAETDELETFEDPLSTQLPTRPLRGVCAPENGQFGHQIDNPYFPLPVGRRMILRGTDCEGARLRVEMEVLDRTELIAGVTTRVVLVKELEDGELVERVHDFYAQAPDGTVCYFGEDVDEIEDGEVVGHSGQWRAGVDGARPGIIMPGKPRPGFQFAQERAPGVAEDRSQVVAVGVPVSVPAGDFQDAAFLLDWNPLEDQTIIHGEHKVYVPGVGLVVDEDLQLDSIE